MALGAFYFSLMSLFVKLVGERIPSHQIVLVRGVLTLVFTWVMLRRAQVEPFGHRRWILLLRGLLGFTALSCLYYAIIYLPLAEATVFQYMNPLWAALLGGLFLAERMTRREVFLVFASLAGVVMIARPAFLFGGAASGLDPVAVVAGVLGGALSGAAYVTVRQLSRTEHPLVIVFYFPVVTIPGVLPFALPNLVMPNAWEWLLLLAVGITSQIGQIYFTRGLRLEPAGRATAVGYLQVIFAALWGLIFFGDLPGLWSIVGSCVILACTLALALEHRKDLGTEPI